MPQDEVVCSKLLIKFRIQFAENGGLFRNRRFTDIKNFNSPDVVECIKPSLSIRNAVNKLIGQLNTQEWDVEITAFDCRDLQILQVDLVYRHYNLVECVFLTIFCR